VYLVDVQQIERGCGEVGKGKRLRGMFSKFAGLSGIIGQFGKAHGVV
jgi:hypothetical protein